MREQRQSMIQTPVSTGVIRPCTTLSTFFLKYLHNVHGLYYDSDPSNYIGQKKATFMLKGSLGYKLVWSHDQILWCSKAFWIDNVWSCGYQELFNNAAYYNTKFTFKKVKLFRVMIKTVYLCLWKCNRNSISLCDNHCDVKI